MITRLRAQHFRSLRDVDLQLGPLSILVGETGAGTSSVLDALAFVPAALAHGLDQALRERGGIAEIRRRTSGHPDHVTLHLELADEAFVASYRLRLAAPVGGDHHVAEEVCQVTGLRDVGEPVAYRVTGGTLAAGAGDLQAAPDRRDLYLRAVSGQPPFDRVYRALRSLTLLDPQPAIVREHQLPDAAPWLARDGRNLASLVRSLAASQPEALERVVAYLAELVPGVTAMRHHAVGSRETVAFRQVMDNDAPWSFFASAMSDGALRAAAILVGVFARGAVAVAVEEPETGLHPGAARLLAHALAEAAETTQVVVGTHSPDLLEHGAPEAERLFSVQRQRGSTVVAAVPEGHRDAVREGLFRVGGLTPARAPRDEGVAAARQVRLFEPG
jgi:predicted ATPase